MLLPAHGTVTVRKNVVGYISTQTTAFRHVRFRLSYAAVVLSNRQATVVSWFRFPRIILLIKRQQHACLAVNAIAV